MNENIDLKEILKDCPKGIKLYSPICGDCTFVGITTNFRNYPISVKPNGFSDRTIEFSIDGKWDNEFNDGECLLFPSKDQRDWSKFKLPNKRFDPKKFKPFDKVLWKGLSEWRASFFSHYLSNDVHEFEISCTDGCFGMVIPYNDETKHLIGTTDDCPEYYKWWLDVKQDDKQKPSLAVND